MRLHVFDAGDSITARQLHGAAVRSDTSARTNTSGNTDARAQAVVSAHISSSDSLKVFFFGGAGGEEGKFTYEKEQAKKKMLR